MTGETVQFDQAAATASPADDAKREQSTIAFPYHDLDAAIEVARAAYNRNGLGACELDELAAQMNQVISGAFRVKLAAARTFGLLDKDGRSAVKLSDLGRRIIADENALGPRVEAFFFVPLYSKIYDAYKGQKLPPMKALEREMASLGVAVKQADKARQAFDRSAKQAGFFDAGTDRLVRPKVEASLDDGGGAPREDVGKIERERPPPGGMGGSSGGSGGGDGGDKKTGKEHPLIQGLLVTLPEPGGDWDMAGRKAWLTMAESIFDMIYKKPGIIPQTPPMPTNTHHEDDDF